MVRAVTAGVIGLVVAAVLVSAGIPRDGMAAAQLAPAMAGGWSGEARIVVNWTQARRLPVRVTIQPDGAVTGTIGDAALRDGRLEPNRTAIGRALHVKTDWIIRGTLDGDVIAAERVRREGVSVPLDFVGGRFEGGVHTTGSHVGGRASMWLAAQGLVLERVKP